MNVIIRKGLALYPSTDPTKTCACGSHSQRPVALRKDGFDIVLCPDCGAGRTLVDQFDPAEHYSEGYFTGQVEGAYLDYRGSETTLRREFRDQVDFLTQQLPSGGKLLEIGCAYGFFLQEAKAHFDVYGVEMVQAAVDFCHQAGLRQVQQGAITEDYLRQHGPFDAIVLLDVIEHIDAVADTAALLTRYLSPNGVILVTTGDWSSIGARLTGAKWRLMTPPLHLWFFTPKSLSLMFGNLGLRNTHISHPWKTVPFELVLSQGLSMLGIRWRPLLPEVFRKAGIPANMFDAMRMVFRKPAESGSNYLAKDDSGRTMT
jgi:SAM-dependent methyltransferase